jgi:cytochrome bd-type quinol oxidase subunit 2
MMRWNKIRPLLAKIVNAGLFMIVGAWLLTQYLTSGVATQEQALEQIDRVLIVFLLIGLTLSSSLGIQSDDEKPSLIEPSPRWSGISPILMTGFALAAATILSGDATDFVILPVMIITCTILIAFLVWRFASKNAEEIGEAQFKPQPPES